MAQDTMDLNRLIGPTDRPMPVIPGESAEAEEPDAEESGEAATPDTSEGEGESEGEEAAGAEGQEGEGEENEDEEAGEGEGEGEEVQSKLSRTEELRKREQSRADRTERLLQEALNALRERESAGARNGEQPDADDPVADLSDEDVLTGKDIKQILARTQASQQNQQQRDQVKRLETEQDEFLRQQKDLNEVAEFYRDEGLDSEASNKFLTKAGQYYLGRAKMLEKQLEQEKQARERAEAKTGKPGGKQAGKPKVPRIPGTGSRQPARPRSDDPIVSDILRRAERHGIKVR